ncbi:MAG: type II secretion system GspH family protein [Planctomycetaceae bacterium]|nr:type II secretion system GspH family protein [Planctomycetaceae bacterium]
MKTNTTRGFTIIELLTVMAVIAVLIGLLVPALNLVKDHAKEIQQKAQFHAIDVGLEMFKSEFGAYPDSFENALEVPRIDTDNNYCGSEKLAEALVGWDLLGFHPKSGFRSDGENFFAAVGADVWVYDTVDGLQIPGSYEEADNVANVKARKGPMIDLENANAFRMQDVYGATNLLDFNPNNFVLCDVFAKKRVSAVKTGMPILYYRARTAFQFQDYGDTKRNRDDVYDYDDNIALINLGTAEAQSQPHEFENGIGKVNYLKFEDMILNTQVQEATGGATGLRRPYRADSYIMISAGKDGIYGTADDIFNFEKGVTE